MRIFISYSHLDNEEFQILRVVKRLEQNNPEIEKVYYWQRDANLGQEFRDYMKSSIQRSDFVLFFCSKNTINSDAFKREINYTDAFDKKGIPIFTSLTDIHPDLKQYRGLQFDSDNFEGFFMDLLNRLRISVPTAFKINAELGLSIIEASILYSGYLASISNFCIALRKRKDTRDHQHEVNQWASRLSKQLDLCGIKVNVRSTFDSDDDALQYLIKSPLLSTIAGALDRTHSSIGGNFFIFCSLIGGIIVAKAGGVEDSATDAIANAKKIGSIIGLPQNIVNECIAEPGFTSLKIYLQDEY